MKVHKVFSIFVVLAMLMAVSPSLSVGASSTVIVQPATPHGWGLLPSGDVAVTTNNATGKVVAGPGGQPSGLLPGSIEYKTNSVPGGKPQLYAPASLAGVKFTDLTKLSYSTYTSQYATGGTWLTHTINVKIDLDGDLIGTTTDRYTLVYEPCYTANSCTGPIQPLNTWSTWESLTPGAIWWSTGSIPGTAFINAFNSFAPLTSLYSAHPNAVIYFIVFQAGQGSGGAPWNDYIGFLDGIVIGINGIDTTYDFEPPPPNQPPTANPGGPYLGAVNTNIVFDGTGSSDPNNNPLTYTWDFGDGDFGSGATPSHSYAIPDIYDVCLTVNDGYVDSVQECTTAVVYDPSGGFVTGGGWIDSPVDAMASISTLVWNQDFSLDDAGWFDDDDAWYGDISVSGGTATFYGDSDSAPFSRFDGYRSTWPGTWIAEIDVYLDPAWPSGQGFDYSVAATGTDGNHQRDYIFHVGVVENYGPITGQALLVNGSNNADFYTNPYKLVNDNGGNYYVVATAGWYTLQHVFRDTGGYLAVDLNFLDSGGNTLWTATRENVADTIPGEVGGNRYSWFTHIDVASGIQVDNHQLFVPVSPTGKATFGFVSKYKKGASIPEGTTEFQFKAGDLNFHSTSYDWLVVNQGGTNAQFKGYGTINGAGNYGFMIWAGDGSPDTFRIKIWDAMTEEVVYDNGMDQPIGGGNIVVHTKK